MASSEMFKANLLSCIATLGFLLSGIAQAQTAGHNDAIGTERSGDIKPRAQASPIASVQGQDDLHRIAYAIESFDTKKQPDDNSSKRSADAAERAAYWALWMVLVAGSETLVTGLGVFLVWQTLKATWAAKNEAKRAADAAEASVKETRRIGEAQVRAYISIKSAAIYFGGDAGMPFIEIMAVNTGQSPATRFVWSPEIRYLSEEEEQLFNGEIDKWFEQPGIDIHAKTDAKSMYIDHEFELVQQTARWKTQPDNIGVSLIVNYAWTDVFGATFIDEASFQGVAEAGNAIKNSRTVHELNTSRWACELIPIAKGEIWTGVAVKGGMDNQKRKRKN